MSILAKNPKAFRDYTLLDKFEAGIQLTGAEVKSVKLGRVQIKDSFIKIDKNNEPMLLNTYIAPYQHARTKEYDPYRTRKLLLHKAQLREIRQKAKAEGLTIVPIKMYNNPRGLIKLEIALAKSRKKYEKKRAIEEKASKRHLQRTLKRHKL